MKKFGITAKLGVIVLLFAFVLVPVCPGSVFAQEKGAASSGDRVASNAGGTGAGAAGAGAAGTGGTAGISGWTIAAVAAGLILTAVLIAAAASDDDGGQIPTTTHSGQ